MISQELLQLSLQSFMSKGCLNIREAQHLIKKCCDVYEVCYSEDQFLTIINEINKNIKKFSFEIRRGISEDDDGESYYCYVNTNEDSHAKKATLYSTNELVFFNAIVERILDTADGSVSSTEVLQARARLSASGAEEVLDRLVSDKWLSRTDRRSSYHLGPRSLIDLLPFLKENNTSVCSVCSSLAIRARICPECEKKVHFHCLFKFANGRNVIKCPHCGENWNIEDK